MADFYRAVTRILRKHNCYMRRQAKGDHEYWYSPINGICFPIPSKLNNKHTANGILKQAGINEKL